MSCNCKRSRDIAQTLGEELVDETFLERMKRHFKKVIFALIMIITAIVAVPTLIVYITYSMVVKGGATVHLPSQVLKRINDN